jgi:PhnB protein
MAKKAPRPVPEGMHMVTPVLNFKGDCVKAIEFFQKAFGAMVVGEVAKGPDAKVMHALIKIGDSNVMLSDLMVMGKEADAVGVRNNLWVYIDNCDTLFDRAVAAGAAVTWPPTDQFWGDRVAVVKDPFGNQWSIATAKWVMTQEEMQKAQVEFFKMMKANAPSPVPA